MAKKRYRGFYRDYSYYPPSKPIPVEEGVILKTQRGEIGENWWSKRWLNVLNSYSLGSRLDRGKSYARKGQIISIDIQKGTILAKVQGSHPRPYHVSIEIPEIPFKDWEKILALMATKAIFMAKLLAGEMPQQIEDVFRESQISLFPLSYQELKTECSCPDSANPCKHIAAVYFILAEQFDTDPFLIFTLRGIKKEELISRLGKFRNLSCSEMEIQPLQNNHKNVENIEELKPELDHHSTEDVPVEHIVASFWKTPNSDSNLSFNITQPKIENALLKRLGVSPFSYYEKNLSEIMAKWNQIIQKSLRKQFIK